MVAKCHGDQNPDSRLPGPYRLHKKFYWCTATPIQQARWPRQMPRPSAFCDKAHREAGLWFPKRQGKTAGRSNWRVSARRSIRLCARHMIDDRRAVGKTTPRFARPLTQILQSKFLRGLKLGFGSKASSNTEQVCRPHTAGNQPVFDPRS